MSFKKVCSDWGLNPRQQKKLYVTPALYPLRYGGVLMREGVLGVIYIQNIFFCIALQYVLHMYMVVGNWAARTSAVGMAFACIPFFDECIHAM